MADKRPHFICCGRGCSNYGLGLLVLLLKKNKNMGGGSIFENVMFMILASQIGALAKLLANILLSVFFTKRVLLGEEQFAILEDLLEKKGYCSNRTKYNKPADGIHFLWAEKLICFKETSYNEMYGGVNRRSYTVYILRIPSSLVTQFNKFIAEGDVTDISVCYANQITLHRTSVTTLKEIPLPIAKVWQNNVVQEVMALFQKKERASLIVSGPTGIGKTSVASFLAVALKERQWSADPVVVFFDPTAKGFDLFPQITPKKETVCILVIDEYDCVIKYAEEGKECESASDGNSMAKSATTWLSTLDRLAKTRFIILLATTNEKLDNLNSRYIRDGRFDLKFTQE
ncbi:MAG: AAA family ATPase [Nitrosomonas sp.]|nr:AAA family ATPase [Nitrosomonas sp.]